jgi:hypothetical protein
MSTTEIRNIGQKITVRRAASNLAITAGAGQDGQQQTGTILDRAAIGWPQSAVFAVPYTTTLGANETLSIAYTVQTSDASDMSSPTTVATASATAVATGAGTFSGAFEANVSLAGARRYVRLLYTPDLSRANTDTAELSAVAVFGGAERLPQ